MKIKKFISAGIALCCTAACLCVPAAEAASFDSTEFFVVTGTYGNENAPLIEYYYYSTGINGTNYKHRKTYCKEDLNMDLSYGDILIANGDFETTRDSATLSTYELTFGEDTTLAKAGNCSEEMEKKKLTVTDFSYDGTPIQPFSSIYTYKLSDSDGKDYYYSVDYFGSDPGVSLIDKSVGDAVDFAVYQDSAIIPLKETLSETELSDGVRGDVNADGDFGIADVILFQKWLLGSPDSKLVHRMAADLNGDGALNVFDLCLMKRKMVEAFSYSQNKITADELIELCEKGKTLTWSDFENYQSEDIGSGLYILKYDIAGPEGYYIFVGGGSLDEEPCYIRLEQETGGTIDLCTACTEDVKAFLAGSDIKLEKVLEEDKITFTLNAPMYIDDEALLCGGVEAQLTDADTGDIAAYMNDCGFEGDETIGDGIFTCQLDLSDLEKGRVHRFFVKIGVYGGVDPQWCEVRYSDTVEICLSEEDALFSPS